jgi:predicted amidophosphoribosyltransferase
MIHIWRYIVDSIFPPSPSLLTLRQYKDIPYANYYKPTHVGDTITLSPYQSPLIKASITAGKFEHNISALVSLGTLLKAYLRNNAATFPPERTILVHIPLHPKRERERGYNQVDIILRAAIDQTPYRIVPLLVRTSNTSPQSHLKRAERLSHLQGVFAYAHCRLDWQSVDTVILVDDVMTTGSTLESARAALLPHIPVHVTLHTLAIAH